MAIVRLTGVPLLSQPTSGVCWHMCSRMLYEWSKATKRGSMKNPATADEGYTKRFKDNPAYQKYVDDPIHNRYPDLLLQTRPLLRIRLRSASKEKLPPPIVPRATNTMQASIRAGSLEAGTFNHVDELV